MLIEFFKNAEKEKEKKNIELMEHKIYEVDKILKTELSKGAQLGDIEIEDLTKQNFANLVFYIISKDKFYLKLYINVVKYFLNKYTKYSHFQGDKEYFLRKLSMSMRPEKFPKDKIIIRKDEIGDKFYIILKGSVSIIIVQESYLDLTQTEYDKYLEKLKIYKEYALIRLVFTYLNQIKADQNILEMIHHELSEQSSKTNPVINNNNDEKISAKEFVERIEPEIDLNDFEERTRVKVATYKIVANLKEGDTFGEIALSDKIERRRTATVITDTDCIMGTILYEVYSSFLKEIEEKNKLVLIGQTLQHTLFREVVPENFLKYNYFNFFNTISYKSGDYLFKQGEIRNAIYFINEGTVNLYTESSFEDIDNYIEYFRKEINKYNKKNKLNKNEILINEDYYINREYHMQRERNPQFNKYFTKKKLIQIYNTNKKETLGYDDCLLEGEKFFVSAKVISHTCQAFVLEINFLNSLLKEHLISKNYIITNEERKEIMLNRLRIIKSTFLDKFLQNNKITYLIMNSIDSNSEKKETLNNFKHSNTILNLKQNINKKEYKYGFTKENDILSVKIKKKYAIKKNKIFSAFTLKRKKNFTITIEPSSCDKKPMIKDRIIQNNIISLKHKLNCCNENKIEGVLFPKLFRNKSMKKKDSKRNEINKNNHTYDNKKARQKINNLIHKMSTLSNKYMIDEYGNIKNKNKINRCKNMTQFDFLFYDYFFTQRGKKNYSKEPLCFDI